MILIDLYLLIFFRVCIFTYMIHVTRNNKIFRDFLNGWLTCQRTSLVSGPLTYFTTTFDFHLIRSLIINLPKWRWCCDIYLYVVDFSYGGDLFLFSGIGITSLLIGNVCTTEEHPGTDKEILSSLVPNTGDGENDNDVSDKNDALPSRPTSKELQ